MPGLRRPDEEEARRIEEFWRTALRENSRFAQGFPAGRNPRLPSVPADRMAAWLWRLAEQRLVLPHLP
jgi:hypothetical protein